MADSKHPRFQPDNHEANADNSESLESDADLLPAPRADALTAGKGRKLAGTADAKRHREESNTSGVEDFHTGVEAAATTKERNRGGLFGYVSRLVVSFEEISRRPPSKRQRTDDTDPSSQRKNAVAYDHGEDKGAQIIRRREDEEDVGRWRSDEELGGGEEPQAAAQGISKEPALLVTVDEAEDPEAPAYLGQNGKEPERRDDNLASGEGSRKRKAMSSSFAGEACVPKGSDGGADVKSSQESSNVGGSRSSRGVSSSSSGPSALIPAGSGGGLNLLPADREANVLSAMAIAAAAALEAAEERAMALATASDREIKRAAGAADRANQAEAALQRASSAAKVARQAHASLCQAAAAAQRRAGEMLEAARQAEAEVRHLRASLQKQREDKARELARGEGDVASAWAALKDAAKKLVDMKTSGAQRHLSNMELVHEQVMAINASWIALAAAQARLDGPFFHGDVELETKRVHDFSVVENALTRHW